MYQSEIIKLNYYIDNYLCCPAANWPKYQVEERSYARWVAYNILEKLLPFEGLSEADAKYRDLPSVYDIIIGLIDSLDSFSEISPNPQYYSIFCMARDSLYDLLCIFE